MQQGGDPTPFDRVLATRYAVKCIEYLETEAIEGSETCAVIGLQQGSFGFTSFDDVNRTYDVKLQRPKSSGGWTCARSGTVGAAGGRLSSESHIGAEESAITAKHLGIRSSSTAMANSSKKPVICQWAECDACAKMNTFGAPRAV